MRFCVICKGSKANLRAELKSVREALTEEIEELERTRQDLTRGREELKTLREKFAGAIELELTTRRELDRTTKKLNGVMEERSIARAKIEGFKEGVAFMLSNLP